jgi:hypothetical protein
LNLRRLSRQIYSLIPLTTREPLQKCKPAILLQALASVNRNTEIEYRQWPTLVSGLRQVVITEKTAIDNKQDVQVYTVAGRVTRKRAMPMFIKRIRGICYGTEAVLPDT